MILKREIYDVITDIRPEIPEPVPSLSRHGAQIGGNQVFASIKITVIRQVRVLRSER